MRCMRGKESIMIFNNAISVPSGWELRFVTVTIDKFPFSELLAVDPKVKDLDKAIVDAVQEYSGSLTGHHALMMVRNNKEGDEPFFNQLLDLLPVDVCKKHGFVILVGHDTKQHRVRGQVFLNWALMAFNSRIGFYPPVFTVGEEEKPAAGE